ncbi:MAG: hypothetical protein HC809_16910 [Gammaproteobacteria bacterium]|nr:hypothetical protein [Gammaproteobacteria bacterium]
MEYGLDTLSRIARDLQTEGVRVARREAGRSYVGRGDLDQLHERHHAATLRLDRAEARLARLERDGTDG